MREISLYCGCDIIHAFIELHKQASELQEDVYADFNGNKIDSTMSRDEVYQTICGMTYEESIAEEKRRAEEYEKREKEKLEQAPIKAEEFTNIMLERGYIKKKDKEEFFNVAKVRFSDLYGGTEMYHMLEIIDILVNNKDNKDEALKLAKEKIDNQGHSGMTYALTRKLVEKYSPIYGDEFYDITLE